MKTILLLLLPITLMSQQQKTITKSIVDVNGFEKITAEALKHRESRMIPIDKFLEYAKDPNTIVLDTRSESAYRAKHLKGAIHINFSEFTEDKLAKLIDSKNTRILIYCNNNIKGDQINFATKKAPLALNIPTYINLYGYGYKNVYELSSLIKINDKRWEFVSSESK